MAVSARATRHDAYPRAASVRDNRWREQAACAGHDTNLWFPTDNQGLDPDTQAICASCPVRIQCAEYALTTGQQHGYWGGLSPDQLREIRRQRGISPTRRPATFPDTCGEHQGTLAGAQRHRRAQETPLPAMPPSRNTRRT